MDRSRPALGVVLMIAANFGFAGMAAPLVATVGYLAIPVAMLLDGLIWGTVPSPWSIGGGALIIVSGSALARRHAPRDQEVRP